MKILRLNWGEVEEGRPDWSPGSGHLYFGVPTFLVDDELFWGNDRLPLLNHYLLNQARG